MGKKKSQPKTTQKKEPQPAGVPKVPQFPAVVAEMAWQVAIPFMVLTLGGNWLDGQMETEPVFTVIGLLLGIASVSLIVYRLVQKHYPDTFNKENK